MRLVDDKGCTSAIPSTRRREVLSPSLRGEEEYLQVWLCHPFQPSPLLDGQEHCGFHSALGHDLRPFGKSGFEELAEPRFGILNRPFLAHGNPQWLSF